MLILQPCVATYLPLTLIAHGFATSVTQVVPSSLLRLRHQTRFTVDL